MRDFPSIDAFVSHLRTLPEAVTKAERDALEAGAAIIKAEAKALIGQEQDAWAPLADSTIAEKRRLGYTGQVSATDPLLRTGQLRDSIESTVQGNEAAIGSDDEIAVWQELGTAKMPPRSFLARAAMLKTDAVIEAIRQNVGWALAGHPRPNRPRGME